MHRVGSWLAAAKYLENRLERKRIRHNLGQILQSLAKRSAPRKTVFGLRNESRQRMSDRLTPEV
jgi:hypothetical protein